MKFTIRDLLLVTVIVALAVGWGLDHRRLSTELEQLRPPELQISGDGTITPPKGFPLPNPSASRLVTPKD